MYIFFYNFHFMGSKDNKKNITTGGILIAA